MLRLRYIAFTSLLIFSGVLCSQNAIHYSHFLDSKGLSIGEVAHESFVEMPNGMINFGFTQDVCWVRCDFVAYQNQSKDDLVFVSQNPITDSVTAYVQYTSGLVKVMSFGTLAGIQDPNYINPLSIVYSDSIQLITLRIKSHTFMRDEFSLKPVQVWQKEKQSHLLFMGLIFGILCLVLLYNVILFIKIKEYSHLYYSFFIACIILLNLYAEGLGNLFIWRSFPSFIYYAEPISSGMGAFGLCMYAITVLNAKNNCHKILYQSIRIVAFSGVALIVLCFVIPSFIASQIAHILPLLSMILSLIVAIVAISNRDSHAKYFILGWVIFMGAASGRIMYNAGVINYSPYIHIAQHIGSIVEAIVFTWLISRYLQKVNERNYLQKLELNRYSQQLDELKFLLKTSVSSDQPISMEDTHRIKIDVASYLKTPLSERELEVLTELAKGLTYQEIAVVLFISKSTVKTHLVNIYSKLDVANRTEAINKARNLNLNTI